MQIKSYISKRYSLLLGFSGWFLLFSLLLRLFFLIWQLNDLDLSIFSLIRILCTGLAFDIGVLSFLFVISTFYLLLIPQKWIGSKLDKVIVYFGFSLTLLIFVFTFFAEITFWEEFKCRFNFVAVDYLIYTFEVVQNIHESYPLYVLTPSMFFFFFFIFSYIIDFFSFINFSKFNLGIIFFIILF